MPPRRQGTITTKEIKGLISVEEICKSDDTVLNQNERLGLTAAVKRQGRRKVAISAVEKGGADNSDVPDSKVCIRSSKQKALHKILSMDKEDSGDCMTEASAQKPNLRERENDQSGETVNIKHNSRKKQGPRAKKELKTILEDPEGVAMEANFGQQSSKMVSDEVKEVSILCTNEVKPDKRKSRNGRAKENNQCKLRIEGEEQLEPQQEKMTTCIKTLRKRGGSSTLAPGHTTTLSPIQPSGNLLNKTTGKLDPLSSLMVCTQEPINSEVKKKDHAVNVRSSTRARKVVSYNEQSLGSAESKAQAETKRNASAAKLIPGGERRMKEDPTNATEEASATSMKRSAFAAKLIPGRAKRMKEEPISISEEILAPDSARVTFVKRGRRHQKLSSPQKVLDKNCVRFRGKGSKEKSREHQEESNIEQTNCSSAFSNSKDLEKAPQLHTVQVESVNPSVVHNAEIAISPAQDGTKAVLATRLEKTINGVSIMHEKRESGQIAHDKVSAKRSRLQCQITAGESSTTADKGVLQQHELSLQVVDRQSIPFNERKQINASRRAKVNSKQRAVPDTAHKGEGDLRDYDEAPNFKLPEPPSVQGTANSLTDAELQEHKGRTTLMRKRTLQGTVRQAKKQKVPEVNCLDPQSLTADMLVEGDAPAQTQEHQKEIQGVNSQGWNAVDITNSGIRVEHSSQKKRREEAKRKRAMRFDALPVGFGLGISCWSTPHWANQSTEEGVIEVEEDSSVIQVQLKNPMEEAMTQACLQDPSVIRVQSKNPMEKATMLPCLQETAMPKDVNNTPLGFKDIPSISNAERIASGSSGKPAPKNDANHRQEKAKAKRQVAQRTKTSKALLSESPQAVHTGSNKKSMLDKENMEPKLHVDNADLEFSMQRSSRRRIATAGKKATRTKKN